MGAIACMPTGFDQGLAAELGNLVVAAYDQFKSPSDGRPSKWPLSAPYELVAEFSASPPGHGVEKFGFVARRQDTGALDVIFRGTQTPGDWLANIDFVQVDQPSGWGRSERGFTTVYNASVPTIIDALKKAGDPRRVFVAGHSLGGALATLCAADVRRNFAAATVTLYTFASPRTGDPTFAGRFNRDCPLSWRIVNTEDLVNTVPLAATAIAELNLASLDRLVGELERFPGLSAPLKAQLARIRSLFGGEQFEHVGTSVDFTEHRGNILDNHAMKTYLAALGVDIQKTLRETAAAGPR